MTLAPIYELEIYLDKVVSLIAQLGILKTYDPKFVFLETIMLQHRKEIEDAIKAKGIE